MSSFIKQLKGFFLPDGKKNVLIIGYKRAGKTTIVEQLMQQKVLRERREETHGVKTKEIMIQLGEVSHTFNVTDIGGSKEYRDMFWKADIAKSDGIIYVIDSSLLYQCESGTTNVENCPNPIDDKILGCGCESNRIFRESRTAKSFAFSIMDTGKPFLIFLNKTDLEGSQPIHDAEELKELYNLHSEKYNMRVETGSALTGDNIMESISWLFSEMD